MTDNRQYNEVAHMMTLFAYEHLPQYLQDVSKPIHDLAADMASDLGHGTELVVGLRKLLEAKDCLVRQAVADRHA